MDLAPAIQRQSPALAGARRFGAVRAVVAMLIVPVLVAAIVYCLLAAPLRAADWADKRTSGPFVARADFRLDEYDGLFVELAQLQTDLSQSLGVEPAREAVELYLFQSEHSYRQYLQARLPQVPYRRALFVKGRGPGKVLAYRSKALPVDVRHEGTHGLLHASLPMVPLWLDEGLAEYFEVPASTRAYGNAYLKWVRMDVRVGHIQRLVQLEEKRDVSEMNATDYQHAWAWTHFLLHGPPEAHDELVKFLADIHDSTPPGRLSVRLEQRLPGLDKRLVQHFKTWKK
jgi:hypothetical protein